MSYIFIFPAYLIWHYTEAFGDIFRIWTNYVWFVFNFFSIPVLVKTLFTPWQKITEGKRKAGFHAEDIAEAVVTTFVMRLVGFFIRTIFIIVGTAAVLIVFWLGIIVIAAWAVLPVLAIASFLLGISKII